MAHAYDFYKPNLASEYPVSLKPFNFYRPLNLYFLCILWRLAAYNFRLCGCVQTHQIIDIELICFVIGGRWEVVANMLPRGCRFLLQPSLQEVSHYIIDY